MTSQLFVYGTLMEDAMQRYVFGEPKEGVRDALRDYRKTKIRIKGISYPTAVPEPGQSIDGLVVTVNDRELSRADRYETKLYDRVRVMLASGTEAFVYVRADDTKRKK